MRMFWFYDGEVTYQGKVLRVQSKYTLEQALVEFKEWPSGAPKYRPLFGNPLIDSSQKY